MHCLIDCSRVDVFDLMGIECSRYREEPQLHHSVKHKIGVLILLNNLSTLADDELVGKVFSRKYWSLQSDFA